MRYRVNFKESVKAVQADVTVEGEQKDEALIEAKALFESAQDYALKQTIKKQK